MIFDFAELIFAGILKLTKTSARQNKLQLFTKVNNPFAFWKK
jgi:hypothetical protein